MRLLEVFFLLLSLGAFLPNALAGERRSDAVPAAEANVATINLGQAPLLFRRVERLDALCPALRAFVNAEAPTVILLQEAFSKETRAVVRECLPHYISVGSSEPTDRRDGLLTLIRARAVWVGDNGSPDIETERFQFAEQDLERMGFERALLRSRLTLESGHVLLVCNTHLSPFARPRANAIRQAQIEELRERCSASEPGVDSVLLGGDLNIAPRTSVRWASNMPPRERAGLEASCSDYDSLAAEYGSEVADVAPHLATLDPDANAFAGKTITGGLRREPARRVDLIFVSRGQVVDARLIFDEAIDGESLYLSDHFGVLATVLFEPVGERLVESGAVSGALPSLE